MEEMNKKNNKGGRKPKLNPAQNRYMFRLTDEENAKFLALFDQSGMDNKAKFIVSLLFGKEMKTVKIDKGTVDFYMRLTSFHSQFRSIGVNYNQIAPIVKVFESTFNIDLGDFYHTFLELKSRKINRTKFLDSLKESLIKKMDEQDER